jgi:hypothetical protein
MTGEYTEVFVPSLISNQDESNALGCFSSEELAWDVLKTHLRSDLQEQYSSASIVKWILDVPGEEGFEIQTSLNCRECPACRRRTFWIDFDSSKGQCHQVACLAWIEEKSDEEVHYGWPPVQFSGQTETLTDAMKLLHEKASVADAAGM